MSTIEANALKNPDDAPQVRSGFRLPRILGGSRHNGAPISQSKQPGYLKRFGGQLITDAKKTIIPAAIGIGIFTLAAPFVPAIAVAAVGGTLTTMGARNLYKEYKTAKAEGKANLRENPEFAAKMALRAGMLTLGLVNIFAGVTSLAAGEPVLAQTAEIPDMADLGKEAVQSFSDDGIDSPAEPNLQAAAGDLANTSNEDIASMSPAEVEKIASSANLVSDAANDGMLNDTSAGAELIAATPGLEASTPVASVDPVLAEQVTENMAQQIMTHPQANEIVALPNASEAVVNSADALVDNGQFADDVIAAERLEAVAEAGGVNAEQAASKLEVLQANMDAGVTSYTIQSSDGARGLTGIVENNQVYSAILDSFSDPAEKQQALQSIIEKIATLSGIDNPNMIFAGQELTMPDLSGVDPSSLKPEMDWAALNEQAGMSHYNQPKP